MTSVLLAGGTGLVGRECLRLLSRDPSVTRLVAISRRPLGFASPGNGGASRVEEHLVDFERLADSASLFEVDAIICALGTTMKKAGSRERFRRVDFDYPLEMARLGAAGGARHFLLVSATGADPRSRIFYNRVKGELEEAVSALPYSSFTIIRPSLLLGDRAEFRLGERIAGHLRFLFPRKVAPVDASDVAAALAMTLQEARPGRRIVESVEVPVLAEQYRNLRHA